MVTVVGTETAQDTTISVPAGVASGDTILLFQSSRSYVGLGPTDAEWITGPTTGATDNQTIYYRIADGTETSFALDGNVGDCVFLLAVLRDVGFVREHDLTGNVNPTPNAPTFTCDDGDIVVVADLVYRNEVQGTIPGTLTTIGTYGTSGEYIAAGYEVVSPAGTSTDHSFDDQYWQCIAAIRFANPDIEQYSDDFELLADGDPLSDDTDWDVNIDSGSGVPTMDQHDDHSDGSQVVDMSTTGDAWCISQTQIGSDSHDVSLDVFIDSEPDHDNHAGPIVRGSAAAHGGAFDGYGGFAYGDANGSAENFRVGIFRIDNGVPTELVGSSDLVGTYDPEVEHTIRLVVDGTTLTLYVNGTQELTTTDTTYSSGQYVGFRLNRTVSSSFSQPFVDNFSAEWRSDVPPPSSIAQTLPAFSQSADGEFTAPVGTPAMPSIRSSAVSVDATLFDSLTHDYDLPATVSDGDLLVVVACLSSTAPGTGAFPAGWTEHASYTDTSDDVNIIVGRKVADGTEGGGTVTLTYETNSTVGVVFAFALENGDNAAGVSATAYDTNTNSLTVTGPTTGSVNQLAFAVVHNDLDSQDPLDYPSGWTGQMRDGTDLGNSTGTCAAIATKEVVAAGSTGDADFTNLGFKNTSGLIFTVEGVIASTDAIEQILPAFTQSAAGTHTPPESSGSIAQTLQPVTQSAVSTNTPKALLDFIAVAHLVFDMNEESFADSDPIGTLTDQTTNSRDATQGTGTDQPTKQTVAGTPVARFDGADDVMTTGTWTGLSTVTYIALAKADDADTNDRFLMQGLTSGTRNVLKTDTGQFGIFAGNTTINAGTDDSDWHVFVAVFDGASSEIYIDGGTAAGTGNAGTEQLTGLSLGAQSYDGTRFWDGDVNYAAVYAGDLVADDVTLLNELASVLAARQSVTWTNVGNTFTASAAQTLQPFSTDAAGAHTPPAFTADVDQTLAAVSQDASGSHTAPIFSADAEQTLQAVSQDATGTHTAPVFEGTAAQTLAAFTQDATGTHVAPVFEGTAAQTLQPITTDATGTADPPVAGGTIDQSLQSLSQDATGTYVPPARTGTAEQTLQPVSQDASGTHVAPVFAGGAAQDLQSLSQDATGTHAPPVFSGDIAQSLLVPSQAAVARITFNPPDTPTIITPLESAIVSTPVAIEIGYNDDDGDALARVSIRRRVGV